MAIDKTGTPMPTGAEYENSVIVRSERSATLPETAGQTIGGSIKEGLINGAVGLGLGALLGGVGGYLATDHLKEAVGLALTPENEATNIAKITEIQKGFKDAQQAALDSGKNLTENLKLSEPLQKLAMLLGMDGIGNANPLSIVNKPPKEIYDGLVEATKNAPKLAAGVGAVMGGVTGATVAGAAGATTGAIKGVFTRKIIEERQLRAQQMQQGMGGVEI